MSFQNVFLVELAMVFHFDRHNVVQHLRGVAQGFVPGVWGRAWHARQVMPMFDGVVRYAPNWRK